MAVCAIDDSEKNNTFTSAPLKPQVTTPSGTQSGATIYYVGGGG